MSIAGLSQTRSLRYSAGLYLLFNSLFLALVLIRPGDSYTFTILDDVGLALGWLIATLFCFIGFKASWKSSSRPKFSLTEEFIHQWAPLFVAFGLFCQFVGQIIYTYYDLNHLINFPSWADVAYLSTFPFLFVGIIFLPRHLSTSAARWCILLDSAIILLTIFTFSWYFVLGPIMLRGSESGMAKIVGSAYPFFDLILIFSVIQLTLRTYDLDLRLIVRFFLLGLLLIVIADSIYDYQTFQHIYKPGWQDVGWPLGYMLLGLSIQAWNIIRNRKQTTGEREKIRENFPNVVSTLLKIRLSKWNAVMSYAFILAVEALTIYVWFKSSMSFLAQGVYFGNIALISLITLRQVFISHQMRHYNDLLYRLQGQNGNGREAATQEEPANLMADFLLLANHELRTPLTGIKGNLQLVQHRLERLKKYNEEGRDQVSENIEQTQKPLASASQSVMQQEHMINAMIDHARAQANMLTLSKKLCNLCTIVENTITWRQQSVPEHRIILETPSTQQVVPVMADEGRITQVINTYLTYALNYSPPERPVTVQLSVEKTAARVAVHDEGAGIPLAEQEHLWECFYRAKGMSIQHDLDLSLGLGLYLCREFIARHHGNVGVQSQPGQGATFWFTLPLSGS